MPDKNPYLKIRRDFIADLLRQNNRLKLLLCISLIGIILLFPATADQYLFNKQEAIELLDHLEKEGFKGLSVIILENGTIPYPELKGDKDAVALYDYGKDVIYFRRESAKSTEYVILKLWHEYGHHLWDKILNDSEKQEYNIIYANSKNFVSKYALEGGHEDNFCESYAYYNTGIMKLPASINKFMFRMEHAHPEV